MIDKTYRCNFCMACYPEKELLGFQLRPEGWSLHPASHADAHLCDRCSVAVRRLTNIGVGGHRFNKNGICECGHKTSDDPEKCTLYNDDDLDDASFTTEALAEIDTAVREYEIYISDSAIRCCRKRDDEDCVSTYDVREAILYAKALGTTT